MNDGQEVPRISLVTPSYNQATYLADTIRSVVSQNYKGLEYVVIDGGSNDGSREILQEFDKSLKYWVSEPDDGQYDAVNKGFASTSGDIMGWLNSDDLHTPWTLSVVGEIFATLPQVRWLTTLYPLSWDSAGRLVGCSYIPGFSRKGFFRGENLGRSGAYNLGWIQQESTFWRRSLWDEAGGFVGGRWKLAGDFDLWARFFQHEELTGVASPIAGFRCHGNQKTNNEGEAYVQEAGEVLQSHNGRPRGRMSTATRKAYRRLPTRLKEKLRLGYEVRTCVFNLHQGWRIEKSVP